MHLSDAYTVIRLAAPKKQVIPHTHTDQLGTIRYRKPNGLLHREDGPAIEYLNGSKEWYQNNKRHRVNGPAIEYNHDDGSPSSKVWFHNDRMHRLDGPAVEEVHGDQKGYWVNNVKYNENNYPEAVREYLINSLHVPYDMPFFALQDYLDELYADDPDFKFEGKTYHELADFIRQNYQNQ